MCFIHPFGKPKMFGKELQRRMDGWREGWMDGWMDGNPYCLQKMSKKIHPSI